MKRTPLARGTSQLKRTSLARETPLRKRGLKPIKRAGGVVQNKAYRDWIGTLPCLFASLACAGPVEVAHVGVRGMKQKSRDEECVPLCAHGHHQHGPESHHVLGKNFWDYHGFSRDEVIARYQRWYSSEFPASA